jgi:hypothetical protein
MGPESGAGPGREARNARWMYRRAHWDERNGTSMASLPAHAPPFAIAGTHRDKADGDPTRFRGNVVAVAALALRIGPAQARGAVEALLAEAGFGIGGLARQDGVRAGRTDPGAARAARRGGARGGRAAGLGRLIGGEPGIGKTQLAAACAARLAREGSARQIPVIALTRVDRRA